MGKPNHCPYCRKDTLEFAKPSLIDATTSILPALYYLKLIRRVLASGNSTPLY